MSAQGDPSEMGIPDTIADLQQCMSLVAEDAADIFFEFGFQVGRDQRFTILRAEDDMHK